MGAVASGQGSRIHLPVLCHVFTDDIAYLLSSLDNVLEAPMHVLRLSDRGADLHADPSCKRVTYDGRRGKYTVHIDLP